MTLSRAYSFFVDEDMSPQTARRLIERGYPAEHAAHCGMSGKTEKEVFERAFDRNQVVITENARDFINLCAGIELHPGVIVLRDGALTADEEWHWLEPVLVHLESSSIDLANKLIEVKDVDDFDVRDIPPPR